SSGVDSPNINSKFSCLGLETFKPNSLKLPQKPQLVLLRLISAAISIQFSLSLTSSAKFCGMNGRYAKEISNCSVASSKKLHQATGLLSNRVSSKSHEIILSFFAATFYPQ